MQTLVERDRHMPETTPAGDNRALEWAILQAIAYADIFDYPLTAAEVCRYAVGVAAPPEAVRTLLSEGRLPAKYLQQTGAYFTLPGREAIVATRRRREQVAARLWRHALSYGRAIARLPYVRMVAVTGALAVDNTEASADIDFLIVTEPGRLWLCRGMIVGLARLAARRGHVICPNYLVTERALVLDEHTLYTAHELAQMVPLAGLGIYRRMRKLNGWTATHLPNAQDLPRQIKSRRAPGRILRGVVEAGLRTPIGDRLEQWEMERKVRKLRGQQRGGEAAFGADWCKGHFEGHGQRTLEAFAERLRALEEVWP